jgi:hypothetical protein
MGKFLELLQQVWDTAPSDEDDPVSVLSNRTYLSSNEYQSVNVYVDAYSQGTHPRSKYAVIPTVVQNPTRRLTPLESYIEMTGERQKKVFDRQGAKVIDVIEFIAERPTIIDLLTTSKVKTLASVAKEFRKHKASADKSGLRRLRENQVFLERALKGLTLLSDNGDIVKQIDDQLSAHPFYEKCPISLPEELSRQPISWDYSTFKKANRELFDKWRTYLVQLPKVNDRVNIVNWLVSKIDVKWNLKEKSDFARCSERSFRRK